MNLTSIIYALRYKHTHNAVQKPQYRNWWWPQLKIIKRDKLTTKNHKIAVVALQTSSPGNLPFLPWKRERKSFYPQSCFDIFLPSASQSVRQNKSCWQMMQIGMHLGGFVQPKVRFYLHDMALAIFSLSSLMWLEFTAFKQKLKYSQVNCVIFAAVNFTLNEKRAFETA